MKSFLSSVWAKAFLALVLPCVAFAQSFQAGKDYEVLSATPSSSKTAKAEVIEFFSYGCPWCFRLEPGITHWQKTHQKQAILKKIPVVFNKDWAFYAKAFYTAHLLGMEEKMTPLLFKAIQEDKKRLNTNDAMIAFFVAQGVDVSTAKSAFESSPTVDLELEKGTQQMSRMHIQGVPALVVNGRCKTDLKMAQSEQRLFELLDELIRIC